MNASNCHLSRLDSIRGLLKILSKFYTIRYDLLEFSENLFQREHLLMAAFICFGSTCFSEHLKVATASFIKQPYYFFLEIFLFKESPKETRTIILTSMMKENSIIFFIMFSWLLFMPTLFKNFSLPIKLKYFHFFNPILEVGVIFTSPIYLGKYLTNSAQN